MNDPRPHPEEFPVPGTVNGQGAPYEAPRLVSLGNVQHLLAGGEGSQDDTPASPTHGA